MMENKKTWMTPEVEKLSISGITEGTTYSGTPDGSYGSNPISS